MDCLRLETRKMLSELVSLKKCPQCFFGKACIDSEPLQEQWFCSRGLIRHKGEVSWSFLLSPTAIPINITYIYSHNSSLPLSSTLEVIGWGWVSMRRVPTVLLWTG